MKILAIRGKNLASLSSEFCVDFQSEPLASAGLYAITGATGAGKSTLLDALCLALYENTPRLTRATAKGESIPDVGENSVGPADPRTLLRRGASEGFAEVDFVGSDAVPYRARWSVRRARNKADGKLQQSEMMLVRLTDNQVLGAHRKSETLKLIERCIGLSFEQFTRAVLLAQNDFAAFLKTSDDDRAELLQTLTGTETFTHLSMQAYARARTENETLKLLQLQLDGQAPIDQETRVAREREVTEQDARIKTIEQQKTIIEGHLRWHQQLDKLKRNENEATVKLDQSRLAKEQAADRHQHFTRIESVQAARPLCAEVARLGHETDASGSALKAYQTHLATASTTAATRKETLDAASRQLQMAEQVRVEAQPGIDQAKALDAQINALTPNYQAAMKARDDAAQSLKKEDARHNALQSELAQSRTGLQSAQRWLVEHATLRPLAEGWQRWETLFSHASRLLDEHRKTSRQFAEATKNEGLVQKALEQATTAHSARVTEHRETTKQLEELGTACSALKPEETARRKQALETQRDQVFNASQLWLKLGEQQKRVQQMAGQKLAHSATLLQFETQSRQCAEAKPLAERDLASAEKSLRIAVLACSENVEQLRATLEVGDPCPVCGSAAHPYAEHNPQLDAVLLELREEVIRTGKTLATLLQRAAGAEAGQLAAQKQLAQLDKEIASATTALQIIEQQWRTQPLYGTLESVPDTDRDAWLAEQQTTVKAGLGHIGKEEALYRALILQKDNFQAAAGKTQAAMTTATNVLARCELEHQKATQARQTAHEKRSEIERQRDLALADLDGAFPDRGWHEAWAADSTVFLAQCRAHVDTWMSRQGQISELTDRITTLTTLSQAALEACANASRHQITQTAQCVLLEGDLNGKQLGRKALFDDQPVNEVIAGITAAIEQAKVALTQRQVESQTAEADRARLAEAVRQTASQLERNQQLFGSANQALGDWLELFNAQHQGTDALSTEALKELLAFESDWVLGERQMLQALDSAIAAAHAVLKEHQGAHIAHLMEKTTDETAEVLGEALTRAVAALEPAKGQVAMHRLALAQDDERRRNAHSLMADIEKRGVTARVWSQLSDLIGSSDGKKFRNFAQQLTLDILLGYANRHLESLSRRYRLERIKDSLGLLVVDQDMGDEVRSVHSLSGGESFLVSLALALGLASLSSHRVQVESLFIDEGFGSLDTDALVIAMEALDSLQAQGRKVGVISHVQEMTERIGTRIHVNRLAGGQSRVMVTG